MRMTKGATSPKMVAFLETVPLALIIIICFGGSCNNIFHVFGACGTTGIFQYGDTGAPDLLCLVAFREKIRDSRLHRDHKGWLSWPMTIIVFGIALTLTLGYIGSDKGLLAYIANSWIGHVLGGVLPGLLLLLVLSVFHRRDAGTAKTGTGSSHRRAAASTAAKTPEPASSTATPVPPPAEPVPSPAAPVAPVVPAAGTGEGDDGGAPPPPWTDEDLTAEARKEWIEHAAMGIRLSQGRFEMLLKQSPRGGAGRARVIKALGVVRAEMDTAEQAEAVS